MREHAASESSTPLQWPVTVPRVPAGKRKAGSFQVTFGRARQHMLDSLEKLGGREFVLSTNLAVRPDGMPYADARRVDDPGVAVYFTRGDQRLCIACDSYLTVESNIRGIGLSVDALRSLTRHGSSHMVHAALVGFKALPAMPEHARWTIVLGLPETATVEEIESAYRRLAHEAHPDRGGTHDGFVRIQRARDEGVFQRTHQEA